MGKLNTFIQNIVPDAQDVFRRFPLAILLVAAFTVLILLEANGANFPDDIMIGLVSGTVLAAYASVILSLIGEGRGRQVSRLWQIGVAAAALLACYFWRGLAFMPWLAIGAAILFIGSAPFWRKAKDDEAVWDFTHKIWTAVIFTVAGSVIYTLGLIFISEALHSLFGLNIRELMQDWLLPIGLGFLAPMAWMSMIPSMDEDDTDSLRNPGFISRAVGFLGTWILAPLTLIYAGILLAYGVKIVLTQSLPNGEIAQLVTPFLIIGTLTWLILDPPFIAAKRLARWYRKLWFPLAIPAAILLAAAVFIRIGEYGVTPERYLLVLAAAWALGIAIWYIARSEKADIRHIPGFAAVLLLIAAIGPWGADGFSAITQDARLKSALTANDMLDADGYLKPADQIVLTDNAAAKRAKGALNYLITARKHARITAYVPASENADFHFKDEDSWHARKGRLDSDKIHDRFGLDKVVLPSRWGTEGTFANYYDDGSPVSVSGYEYMSTAKHFDLNPANQAYHSEHDFGDYMVKSDKGDLVVMRGEDEIARTSIASWLKTQPVSNEQITISNPRQILVSGAKTEIAIHVLSANISRYEVESENPREDMSIQVILLGRGIGNVQD